MFFFCSKVKSAQRTCPRERADLVNGEMEPAIWSGLGTESSLLLAENRHLGPDGFPIEEVMAAGPAMDLGIADAAIETPRAPVRVFLSRRGVIHPAAFAGEFFCGPDGIGHGARYAPAPVNFSTHVIGENRGLFGRRRLQPRNTHQQELEQRPLATVSRGLAGLLPAIDERLSGSVTDPPIPPHLAALFDDHLEHRGDEYAAAEWRYCATSKRTTVSLRYQSHPAATYRHEVVQS
jgi:hypothetical protein